MRLGHLAITDTEEADGVDHRDLHLLGQRRESHHGQQDLIQCAHESWVLLKHLSELKTEHTSLT